MFFWQQSHIRYLRAWFFMSLSLPILRDRYIIPWVYTDERGDRRFGTLYHWKNSSFTERICKLHMSPSHMAPYTWYRMERALLQCHSMALTNHGNMSNCNAWCCCDVNYRHRQSAQKKKLYALFLNRALGNYPDYCSMRKPIYTPTSI